MSLVSVCVPLYNGEKYLRESLDCIVNQTYKDLEILIVDDCSLDDSMAIAQEYQLKDGRIRIVHNQQNLGLVGNWNRCIKEAKGEYVKFHFQDDLMMNDTIEKMVLMAKNSNLHVVITDREYIFEDGINNTFFDRLPRLSDYFRDNAIIKPTFISNILKDLGIEMNFMGEPILGLVREEVFSDYGKYDESLRQIVDFEFWIRLALNIQIGFIPERLHTFRVHGHSEGARNRVVQEMNPSHLDRIHFASKLNSDKHYEKFRKIVGKNFTETLLSNFIKTYTTSYGRKVLAKYINEDYFQYLDSIPWWKRLFREK
ncbi:Glycosyltransferase involved in cell wall bisynthesis [Ekhidna lutea]|uniref:Glycosyltransferase involved in cell wall bisynthesis n=1 Tax=Ekhidna lutea TaxID=447679 RepID=A0A239FPU9_EKHLU|nr:glycosyltransferase family 2 protein [Ekhidna lutea]SNS58840.1 Glycosyltransferase involved in cell wall bisynthesis [Ekhidna lutea]